MAARTSSTSKQVSKATRTISKPRAAAERVNSKEVGHVADPMNSTFKLVSKATRILNKTKAAAVRVSNKEIQIVVAHMNIM